MRKIKNFFSEVMVIASFIALMWVTISFFEVVTQNSNPDITPEYSKYNIFVMVTQELSENG